MRVSAYGASSKRFRKIPPNPRLTQPQRMYHNNNRAPPPLIIGTGAQKYRRVKGKRSFYEDIDNRIMKPRSAGGTTQDRGRGRFQTRPRPNGPRRCPPEVEDRLGRNADRQPGHCGIVAQVLGCGRMTPAPTSKPDGHPQDVGAALVVARTQGFARSRSERIP